MSTAAAPTTQNVTLRNFTKRESIRACKLNTADLKKLYRLINEKQLEASASLTSGMFQKADETPEQFQERRTRAYDACLTTVQVIGFNAETVTGTGEDFFDSPLLPERFNSIEYDTGYGLRTQFDFKPNFGASVFLDFRQPSIFGQGLPSEPTPNKSNWSVTGQNEAWATSLSTRLEQFFSARKTTVDWLHRSNTYDVLLILIGAPLALWGAYRIGHPIAARFQPPSAIETTLYVYAFFLALSVFRYLFSYARWVFPKVELTSEKSAAGIQRVVWGTLTLGILGSALWDAIKALVG